MPLLTTPEGRKLYVLRRISTSEVLNRNVLYPNAVDDAPIEGFDPDLEYLAMDSDAVPDYDSRVFSLVTNEAKVGALWRITFSTLKWPTPQIKIAVTNAEAAQVQVHVDRAEREKLVLLGLGVLFSTIQGLTLTGKQTAVKNRIIAVAAKLWQNDQRAADMFAEADADITPNFESGWAAKQ